MTINSETLSKTISACTSNGKNLLDDAKLLLDWDRFSTSFALSILAQEEFSKAFLLNLVADEAIPWIHEVRRSMARHQCKQLLTIVMEWVDTWDFDKYIKQHEVNRARHEKKMEWFQRRVDGDKRGSYIPDPDDPEPIEPDVIFPSEVANALNIYRHEEIERFHSGNPWRDTDWSNGKARKIADGSLERKKQSGFYVNITKTGEIGLHPGLITREDASNEIKRAEHLSEGPAIYSDEYRKLKEILPSLFKQC